ncbi:tetratricopeptide repeat protein [Pararhodobacter zhoushanensis]|uniref:Tetratricopeptide repeat protein n=1 Tax=Pararhodobacter zhoushanensis TaxID=2479545 RepID=A0ABT3H405_9RHOB|nr:tetratricopeptide repeat protein [Pararhodobacter zhoushanensis]MCW1934501.1 tetratricopeptide repeat protein [Pararhodobacter zhoushanensis]
MDQAKSETWDHARVNRLIEQKDYANAASQIAAFLDQQPTSVAPRIARVRLLLATGELAEARALATQLLADAPDNLWVWALGIQALTQDRDIEGAVALFGDGQARLSPDDNALAAAVNGLLPALGSWSAQVAFLKDALARQPDSRTVQLRLASRAMQVGDFDLALQLLQKAEETGPLPAYAKSIQSRLYPMTASMADSAERVAQDISQGHETSEALCRLCRFAAAAGNFEQAQRALMRALDLFPADWRVLYRLNRVFLPAAQDTAVYARLATQAERGEVDQNWQLQFALFALRAGQADMAQRVLRQLTQDPRIGETALSVLAALEALGDAPPRAGVLQDADLCVVRAENPQGTLFVFGSFLGGVNYVPNRNLDALFADLAVNVVYLRDPSGRAFLNGLPGIGAGEQDLHDRLQRLAAELGGAKIVTMGSSAAGYAALRAGLAIKANAVISLAGLVAPPRDHDADATHLRQGDAELFREANEPVDLRPVLAGQPQTHLMLVIGESYAPDVARSDAVKGIANATVIAVPGATTHHVGMPAMASGLLRDLVRDAFAG